jgi:hypothetical protein
MSDPAGSSGNWTLLTGHGHVLVEIARDPEARIRDISVAVGLTERTVQAIVADLEAAGYLTRTRNGRRTKYSVNRDSLFRHSAQEGLRVGPLLDLLAAENTLGAENAPGADYPPAAEHGTARADEATGGEGPQAPTTPGHRPMLRRRRR